MSLCFVQKQVLLTLFLLQSYTCALSPRACVIGAGYSGLGTARYLKQNGVDFTVFEATKYVGGIWRFDPHVGLDEDGIPVMTKSYENLRVNTPKQFVEYYDFPFPEGTSSYPSGTCVYKYLVSFVNHFNLLENIQFRSFVTSLRRTDDHWDLTYLKTDTNEIYTETCDYVVVSTGLYMEPKWPNIAGMEIFKGSMIHSNDYKSTAPYINRRVLVVGGGSSGMDISVFLTNVTSVLFHSHHRTQYDLTNSLNPEVYVKKPDVATFTETGAIFNDNTFEEFDDVIFCTGYGYAYPFLDFTSGLIIDSYFVAPLYRHIININYPSMFIIGITRNIILKAIDAQVHYAANSIAGKFKLPSQEEMMKKWVEETLWTPLFYVNYVYDMDQYFANMTLEAGVPRVPPVYTKIADYNNVLRVTNFTTFRDYTWDIIDDYNYVRYYAPTKDLACPIDV